MFNFTLSDSLKKMICDTLNENLDSLKKGETQISSLSNTLSFVVSFINDGDFRTLTVPKSELGDLNQIVFNILPDTLYVSGIGFKK